MEIPFCADWDNILQDAEIVGFLWKKKQPLPIEMIAKELKKNQSDIENIVRWLVYEQVLVKDKKDNHYFVFHGSPMAVILFAISESSKEKDDDQRLKKFAETVMNGSFNPELRKTARFLATQEFG